jgi:hypothetical protein
VRAQHQTGVHVLDLTERVAPHHLVRVEVAALGLQLDDPQVLALHEHHVREARWRADRTPREVRQRAALVGQLKDLLAPLLFRNRRENDV